MKFGDIDKIIAEVKDSSGGSPDEKGRFSNIDSLCADIDQGFEDKSRELSEWSHEQKRTFAIEGDDPFVLNLLTKDKNFNIRILAFSNPDIPEYSMSQALRGASEYVRLVIANNPRSSSSILDRIARETNEPEVLDAIRRHKNISRMTKLMIQNNKQI